MASESEYVRLVNVTKRFGDVTAVDNLSYNIGKGECFSMLGPSGCGKTTTLRMVAGFEDLSEGRSGLGTTCFPPRRKITISPGEAELRHGLPGLRRLAPPLGL